MFNSLAHELFMNTDRDVVTDKQAIDNIWSYAIMQVRELMSHNRCFIHRYGIQASCYCIDS